MSKVIWFTGLSGAGKSTIAEALRTELAARGKSVRVLDGDAVRDTLHKHLTFTREDIKENNRLIAEIARAYAREADIVLVPIISPFGESRADARKVIGKGFVEVYVESSEATRIARDPKGLYQKAKEGSVKDLIGYGGVSYEAPTRPDITVNTDVEPLAQSAERILRFLEPERNIFFIYEPEHIPLLQSRLARGEVFTVVPLDYCVELELQKRGVPFTSLRALAHDSPDEERGAIEFVRRLTKEWYAAPELAFFRHDGIMLGEQHRGMLNHYFGALVYYSAAMEQVLSRFSPAKIVIPERHRSLGAGADPTAFYKERLEADVAALLAGRSNIPIEILSAPLSRAAKRRVTLVMSKILQSVFRTAVFLSNLLVSVFQKQRPVRILSTDPWSRTEPFITAMDDAEIVMTHRKEMYKMGLASIWRARARFHHRLDFADRRVRALARERAREFVHAWEALGESPEVSKLFEYGGVSFWPVARAVLGAVVADAEDAVATIESTKSLLKKYGINRVLLFGSTKGYNNLTARVAERMGIPSIELQHALEVVELSNPHAELYARYLAAYGPLTKKHYSRFGVEPWRVIECGSPRFDAYVRPVPSEELVRVRKNLRLQAGGFTALVVLPPLYLGASPGNFTTYGAQAILEDIASLQKKISPLHLILRPRPGNGEPLYYRDETLALFHGRASTGHGERLQTLLALSDFVISGNSAVVLEALIMRRPVLMYLPQKEDHEFDEYADAGAVLMARTNEELLKYAHYLQDADNRAALVAQADRFLKDNFMMDGRSALRVAALLRTIGATRHV